MPVARRRSPLEMRQKDRPSQASPARRLMARAARPELEMQRGAVPGRRAPRYRLSPTPPWLRLVPVTRASSHRAGGFSRARLGPVLATTHLFLWESGRLHFTLSASPLTRGISLSGACGATVATQARHGAKLSQRKMRHKGRLKALHEPSKSPDSSVVRGWAETERGALHVRLLIIVLDSALVAKAGGGESGPPAPGARPPADSPGESGVPGLSALAGWGTAGSLRFQLLVRVCQERKAPQGRAELFS